MASADIGPPKPLEKHTSSPQNGSIEKLTDSVEKVSLHTDDSKPTSTDKKDESPPRPLHVYRRPQILLLSKSPLVKQPDGMPPLKDWFGDWNEQQSHSKKDPEQTTTPSNMRERRFRRDVDDGELPARPSYRTNTSQFSQMGNFRHQSIRNTDRDKDKDGDRERERDMRDKEGQERLRSLSDKYDRDRLAMTSGTSIRNKERDTAPHLNSGRDAPKRKIGDNSDDWRRVGPESARGSREDRTENSRRDRDNRERPRSRSRPRREPSTTRRERDRDERDRDRRDRRGDDRDDHRRDDYARRDRDDYPRREWDDHYPRDRDDLYRDGRDRYDHNRQQRDLDRDLDDDSRRWRDDGKRDERIATRRDRERGWDRWEPSHDRDRADDRDRGKRPPARDRRTGAADDGKDKEERRDRDREKEKEPAWMETYVPPPSGGGILGGKGVDGELDGIQAWKKGLKEKERKDKEPDSSPDATTKPPTNPSESSLPAAPEGQLDEIQLFKLMMKREAEKKDSPDQPVNGGTGATVVASSGVAASENSSSGSVAQPKPGPATNGDHAASHLSGGRSATTNSVQPNATPSASPEHPLHPSTSSTLPSADSRTLLSLITSGTSDSTSSSPNLPKPPGQSTALAGDGMQPAVSRVFPTPLGISPSNSQGAERQVIDSPSTTAPFNPPPGSRLLAFGSRTPSAASATSGIPPSKAAGPLDSQSMPRVGIPPGAALQNVQKHGGPTHVGPVTLPQLTEPSQNLNHESQYGANPRATPADSTRSARSFSPFAQGSQASFAYEDVQEGMHIGQAQDHLRRASVVSAADRAPLGLVAEGGSPYSDYNGPASNFPPNGSYDVAAGNLTSANYAAGKGSRFAKFFDTKSRDGQGPQVLRKNSGLLSTSPHPGPRQDPSVINGLAGNPDNRTMEDIFAMLQNSAQTHHRVSPQIGQPGRIPSGGGPYGQNIAELQALQLQQLQQQQQQQQQFVQQSRLDSLYDSRLDDRNFVPDGMVPGLRPVPRPRSREPTGVLFNEQLDDPLHFNVQRIPQPPRNLDQIYPGQAQQLYNQHGLGRGGVQMQQQAQFRGGPSPIPGQNPLQGPSQRLPPGLANLGGRPPHDPSQYLGSQIGVSGAGIPGGIHPNAQQGFGGNFGGGGLGYAGGPQGRGPVPGPHLQNQMALNQMAGMNPANNLELRGPSQAQLLGLGAGGLGGVGGGLRATSGGFVSQHGPTSQMHHPAMRPQQQLPPQMLPQMLPPHLQQQQGIPGGNSQGTQDLMALLMGGHRD